MTRVELAELGVPRIQLAKLYKRRGKLEEVMSPHIGSLCDIDTCASITASIADVFTRSKSAIDNAADPWFDSFGLDADTNYSSLYYKALSSSIEACLFNKVLDTKTLASVAIRLAASSDKILAGIPVSRWVSPLLVEEWVAVSVKDIELIRAGLHNRTAGLFTVQVLTGSPAGETLTVMFWATMFSTMLRKLGMRCDEDGSVLTFRNLVNSKFAILLTTDDPPKAKQYQEIPVLNKINRELHKARTVDRECPNGYMWSCSDCYVGYDKCLMGTHPNTFVLKACPSCRAQGWFDPQVSTQSMCLDCQVKRKMMVSR